MNLSGEKRQIRLAVWRELERQGAALFPGTRGRIPNFRGAADAAHRLSRTAEWKRARVVKCNPDSPQRPVRLRALREGKRVFMAVPRLTQAECFWELDPGRIRAADLGRASSIRGAARLGRPVDPRKLPHVDLIVAGSVAVDRRGARVGKGGGYSDLEYAIGLEVGAIDGRTTVATTVHELQIRPAGLPMTAHDFWLDLIVTPDRVLRPPRRGRRQPTGILPADLEPEKRREIPILSKLGF